MSEDNKIEQYLSEHIAFSLIGKLTNGIVHNLNGPLQILSMQIELFNREIEREISDLQGIKNKINDDDSISVITAIIDKLQKRQERIEQLETTINRMENIVNVISKRCRGKETLNNTIFVNQIIEEELLFWEGDLFFKHNVEKKINLSTTPIFIQTEEINLRTIIDLMLAASIISLKQVDNPVLKISSQIDEKYITITINQSGKDFCQNDGNLTIQSNILDILTNINNDSNLDQLIILHLTKYLCNKLNANLIVNSHELVFNLSK